MNERIRGNLRRLGLKFMTYKCKKCGKEFKASVHMVLILCPKCREIYDKQ